jgi:hypothetical protein
MSGCSQCGAKLDVVGNQVGRRDCCPICGADLHSCLNCRHYDPTVAKGCKEPFAEVPEDKESGNFCDFFQIGEGGQSARRSHDAALSAAEALFKKG